MSDERFLQGAPGAPFFSPLILAQEEASVEKLAGWELKARVALGEVHPNRLREWALGRLALETALAREGVPLGAWDGCAEAFQRIPGLDGWRFSLSHTDGHAGAWVVPEQGMGIGLDIELKRRAMDPAVGERLRAPGDAGYDPLLLWTVKEAAYKALTTEQQKGVWLNRLVVEEGRFRVEGAPQEGRWLTWPHPELWMVGAYTK